MINFLASKNNFESYSNSNSILLSKNIIAIKPIVSIVIPTFKRDVNILSDAVNSVLNQVDFYNFELIILDNNPNLFCPIHNFVLNISDNRIFYYKNSKNLGMYGNWNRGFELSSTDWVVFLHDDDVMSPYFLSSCLPFFKDLSIGILKPLNYNFYCLKDLNFSKPKFICLEKLHLIDFFWGCAVGAPTNVVYNKKEIIKIGGFNNDFFPSADYVLSINMVLKSNVYRIPYFLGGYRINQNESLNSDTMNKFFLIRYQITTFVMKKLYFPNFLIQIIHSCLTPSLIKNTNQFYGTNIKFDYLTELGLKPSHWILEFVIKGIFSIFVFSLKIFRKISSVFYFLKFKL